MTRFPVLRTPGLYAMVLVLLGATLIAAPGEVATPHVPLSFSNRVLLNRVSIDGLRRIEVMVLAKPQRFQGLLATLAQQGGMLRYSAPEIGYVRADIPLGSFATLASAGATQALQIATLSMGSWYRDTPPRNNAEMFRSFERVTSSARLTLPVTNSVPELPEAIAHQPAYSADGDSGVGDWLRDHPTFDGRGITVAILETGNVDFAHPAFTTAAALDGRPVPKVAGILQPPTDRGDPSRVLLDTPVTATHAWVKVHGRTLIVPRPGRYRVGVYRRAATTNAVHEFPVLEDQITGTIYVDTDGDADFRDERPITDANDAIEPQALKLTYPEPSELSFVAARGPTAHTVYIYTATYSHTTMFASIVAGTRGPGYLGRGVAPGARVLLIPVMFTNGYTPITGYLEAFITAMRRPDVDILCDDTSQTIIPDTSADFVGTFFTRLIGVYDKPVFHLASNARRLLNSVSAFGGVLSVGGSVSPDTMRALFGGVIGGPAVHSESAGGPAVDGALKPDFLAPVHAIVADLRSHVPDVGVPRNAPRWHLPRGYEIGCCTSSSTPYAAGVGALLLSAAKQTHAPYSAQSLGRALRVSAHFLPGWPAHLQGSGLIDVQAAWNALADPPEIPAIRVASSVAHPLAPYSVNGSTGIGLFEQTGWHAGMSGQREFRFTRTSGPADPTTYRVSWTGNDGTFHSATSVTLPLNETVPFPVDVNVASAGAHSALLSLHAPVNDAVILRTQATIVASLTFEADTKRIDVSGTLALMQSDAHYVSIPKGTNALDIEIAVERGTLAANVVPASTMYPWYYGHVYPSPAPTYGPGTYHLMMPNPSPGVWSINLRNDSVWREIDPALVSTSETSYKLAVRMLKADVTMTTGPAPVLQISNRGTPIAEPVVHLSPGTVDDISGTFLPTGLPNLVDIDIPEGTETLQVTADRVSGPSPLELHLYDCTDGECFSYDFTLPAVARRTMTLRTPKPGRWVAAINAAPTLGAPGKFRLTWMVAGASVAASMELGALAHGARMDWALPASRPGKGGNALLVELIDAATERRVVEFPWQIPLHTKARMFSHDNAQPVSAGWTILRGH